MRFVIVRELLSVNIANKGYAPIRIAKEVTNATVLNDVRLVEATCDVLTVYKPTKQECARVMYASNQPMSCLCGKASRVKYQT